MIKTNTYLAAPKDVGMSAEEQQMVVDLIAANPEAGEIMPKCGGARKVRVVRPDRDKVAAPIYLAAIRKRTGKTPIGSPLPIICHWKRCGTGSRAAPSRMRRRWCSCR